MKRAVAILLMIVLLVSLCGCKREPLKVTRVPVVFNAYEGSVFEDTEVQWRVCYEKDEIDAIEMKLSFRDMMSDYDYMIYRRAIGDEERTLSYAFDDYKVDVDIMALEIQDNTVSYGMKGEALSFSGEMESMEENIQRKVTIKTEKCDDQGNDLLLNIDDYYELSIRYMEMEEVYPEWTYEEMRAVSLLSQEMVREFFYIFHSV